MCILWYRLFREMFTGQKAGRFGYITLTPNTKDTFWNGGNPVRGHEFHYFDSTDCGSAWHAAKPLRKRNWECIHATKRMMAGFPHLYYMASQHLALEFLEQCVSYRERKNRRKQDENSISSPDCGLWIGPACLEILLFIPSDPCDRKLTVSAGKMAAEGISENAKGRACRRSFRVILVCLVGYVCSGTAALRHLKFIRSSASFWRFSGAGRFRQRNA